MHSIEDVFTNGVMDTIAASGGKFKYFDPADDDVNSVDINDIMADINNVLLFLVVDNILMMVLF